MNETMKIGKSMKYKKEKKCRITETNSCSWAFPGSAADGNLPVVPSLVARLHGP